MRNLVVVGIIVLISVVIGGLLLFKGNDQSGTTTTSTVTSTPSTSLSQPDVMTGPEEEKKVEEGAVGETTIRYTSSGFSPSSVTVKSGDKVTWVNNDNKEIRIGVNPHPQHTSNQEVSGGEYTLNLGPGEQKSVVITKTGTFGYHNHLNASQGGSITIE